jgi:hypothetical protein
MGKVYWQAQPPKPRKPTGGAGGLAFVTRDASGEEQGKPFTPAWENRYGKPAENPEPKPKGQAGGLPFVSRALEAGAGLSETVNPYERPYKTKPELSDKEINKHYTPMWENIYAEPARRGPVWDFPAEEAEKQDPLWNDPVGSLGSLKRKDGDKYPLIMPKGGLWQLNHNVETARKRKRENLPEDNLAWFYTQTKAGGPWDYKQDDIALEGFGNLNFGATARALGIHPEITKRTAGFFQNYKKDVDWGHWAGKAPYGDDPGDQYWINEGMKFGEKKMEDPDDYWETGQEAPFPADFLP